MSKNTKEQVIDKKKGKKSGKSKCASVIQDKVEDMNDNKDNDKKNKDKNNKNKAEDNRKDNEEDNRSCALSLTQGEDKPRYPFTQNRELSWLRFNQRVLEEAADEQVPLLERLKFISIFSSNLDEFFMVRVGSLFDLHNMTPDQRDNKTGMTAKEQLDSIYRTVPGLITLKNQIYSALCAALRDKGIEDVSIDKLTPDELKLISRYFKQSMLPILSPIIVGSHHPVPHIVGKHLYVAALLLEKPDKADKKDKSGKKDKSAKKDKAEKRYKASISELLENEEKLSVGIVGLPGIVPPYIMLPGGLRYVRTENILMYMLPALFESYAVLDSCTLCVTRNADISFDDEKFEDNDNDCRAQMTQLIKKRDNLSVVRLELNQKVSKPFMNKLLSMVKLSSEQVFVDACPLNMKFVFGLTAELDKNRAHGMLYKPYTPRKAEDFIQGRSVTEQVLETDKLLFYPYDSVDPFLKLLSEAADDPDVLSIKITIYRLASSSKIAHILCRAAENGKDVLVLMELRARFDEANNIAWSEMLEDAGCQVIYGMEGFKCHSKICLITMRKNGQVGYITQVGTGNYNEKTNTQYTDLSLMTASDAIGEDAAQFFRNMLVNNLNGTYNELCVSPYGIKAALCDNIDEQIKLGSEGYICIKANSVTELDIMNKLSEASRAGVKVELIIRGICCLLPGITEYTENVHVTSIVGRYLEHARIYCFGKGDDTKLYISSADLMTRNLNRRVEIACPVHDAYLKSILLEILKAQLRDSAKASFMLSDGVYSRKLSNESFDSQNFFMEHSLHKACDDVCADADINDKTKANINTDTNIDTNINTNTNTDTNINTNTDTQRITVDNTANSQPYGGKSTTNDSDSAGNAKEQSKAPKKRSVYKHKQRRRRRK